MRKIPGPLTLWIVLVATTAANYRGVLETVGGRSASGETLGEALYDPTVTSPAIGLMVFGVLVYLRRKRVVEALGGDPAWGLAAIGLIGGSLLRLWSFEIRAPDLLMLSLILQLVGITAALGGRALLSAFSLPLLALCIVVPLPPFLVNTIVFPMQLGTANLTSAMLDLIGRPHLLAGDQIATRGIIFQVIEGCSGMKSTLSLLLASVLYAELVGKTCRAKMSIVLLAIPIGFLANGIRVLILVLGEVPAESVEHEVYGLLMVAVGVFMLSLTEWLLNRLWAAFRSRRGGALIDEAGNSEESGSALHAQRRRLPRVRFGLRLAVLSLISLLVAIAAWSLRPGTFTTRKATKINIERLPTTLEGRDSVGSPFPDQFLGSVRFRHRIHRTYRSHSTEGAKDEAPISVFVGLEDSLGRNVSGYSKKTAYPRSGWLSSENVDDPFMKSVGGDRHIIVYPQGRFLGDHFRIGYAPWAVEFLSSWFGLEFLSGERLTPSLVIRVETEFRSGELEAAEERLGRFSRSVWNWYVPPE